MAQKSEKTAGFHLPGLFEFFEFYKLFLPIFYEHRAFFYPWVEIASIYGAPADCLWGGGREGVGEEDGTQVLDLLEKYGISARLTFSNSLLREEHLADEKCNALCDLLEKRGKGRHGVIVHSELLQEYIRKNYPGLYLVSSTTKVLTDHRAFLEELHRPEFQMVVADFRLNMQFDKLKSLTQQEKDKVEFLCNECCWVGCQDRKRCYESVSAKILGEGSMDHQCSAPEAKEGYRFSKAMNNPAFIGKQEILHQFLPAGFTNFKIEGRTLGSAIVLEFLLYYLVKPEYHLQVREMVYLDSMLDLF